MSENVVASPRSPRFQAWVLGLSLLAVLVALFVPLLLTSTVGMGAAKLDSSHAEESVVGIAVLLRATARRLLRTASGNVMRTTFATMTRASSRAATRQLIKFSTRIFAGSVLKGAEGAQRRRNPALNLSVGFVALVASFYGVLLVSDPVSVHESTGLGPTALSVLAALPLLAYGGITVLAARALGVRVGFATDVDGLILQGYFTGSGSFLPMTTDLTYEGDERSKSRLALISLGGLYLLHLLMAVAAAALDSPVLGTTSTFFLIYSFVYAFPIRPLEGHDVWRRSKLLWLLLWSPILASFILTLPPEFGAVL